MPVRPFAASCSVLVMLIGNHGLIEAADSDSSPQAVPQQSVSDEAASAQSPVIEESEEVHTATVVALDGTRLDMMINSDGQAVTVATESGEAKRKHKHHHHADEGGDSPADEQLNAGLINETSPAVIEDGQPQVSNDLPH